VSTAAAVLPALALREGRRILLHPVPIGLALASTVPAYLDPAENVSGREEVAGILAFLFLFLVPVAVIFAANLVASSARRAGAGEMLDALPTGHGRRTLAVCAGGVGIALLGNAAALTQYLLGRYDDVTSTLTAWEVVCVPVMYLGAVAFGVAVARWLPWPGAALLGAIGLVLWTYSGIDNPHISSAPYVLDVNFWGDEANRNFAHQVSDVWHAAYLACLVLLAAAAAVLRERPRRLLVVGPVLAGAAVLLALVSMP
jgi:hypothetical protein